MSQISLDEAATRTLKDVVAQACERRETVVVVGPHGELARVVPTEQTGGATAKRSWRGRPVYDAEQLSRMTPEELKSIGWLFPDESAWVDEIAGSSGESQGQAEWRPARSTSSLPRCRWANLAIDVPGSSWSR